MQASPLRLAHGWTLSRSSGMSPALVREFIRPAVRAVPSSMARRFGFCRISLPAEAEAGVTSQWTITNSGLEVLVTTTGFEEHDVAMELLLGLGQGLWERLSDVELRALKGFVFRPVLRHERDAVLANRQIPHLAVHLCYGGCRHLGIRAEREKAMTADQLGALHRIAEPNLSMAYAYSSNQSAKHSH
jgi:hypothetical protein